MINKPEMVSHLQRSNEVLMFSIVSQNRGARNHAERADEWEDSFLIFILL